MKIEDIKVGMKVRILPTACFAKYSDNSDTQHKNSPGWRQEMQDLVGTIQKVSFVGSHFWVYTGDWIWLAEDLEPVVETQQKEVYPNPPHKHKDLIVAWANGAQIEREVRTGVWVKVSTPTWEVHYSYRIQPNKPVEPPKPGWIKVDGVRPEGIPDGTKVEWVSKDGRSAVCLINRLGFQKGSTTEVIFIKIVD